MSVLLTLSLPYVFKYSALGSASSANKDPPSFYMYSIALSAERSDARSFPKNKTTLTPKNGCIPRGSKCQGGFDVFCFRHTERPFCSVFATLKRRLPVFRRKKETLALNVPTLRRCLRPLFRTDPRTSIRPLSLAQRLANLRAAHSNRTAR